VIPYFGLLALLACAGCGAASDAQGLEEDVGATHEASIVGFWTGTFSNGDAGLNPRLFGDGNTGVVICEAIDGRDSRQHPGKLWNGTCRYEWGGGVVYAPQYSTLQVQGTFWLANSGFTPANAIAGSLPGQLPVCRPHVSGMNSGFSGGKVWLGSCLGEFGDHAVSTTNFDFLIRQ